MPKILLLPPLMLALLLFGAPIQDGDVWRVDQLTRTGPQKTLSIERQGDTATATVLKDGESTLFVTMQLVDADKGRISIDVGGSGPADEVELSSLIKDFDRKALQTSSEIVIELQNGEEARFFRSGDVVYLTAPGQGVTFAARKVE